MEDMTIRYWILVAGGVSLAAALPLFAARSAGPGTQEDLGADVFNRCAVCHQVGPHARVGLGPPLNDLFGRRAGSLEGFQYSSALKGSGITWNDKELKAFLRNPRQAVPGVRMVFPGIKDDRSLEALIQYLHRYSASAPPKE